LLTGSNYFFRAISHTGIEEYSLACRLIPMPAAAVQTLEFDVTKSWKYTTNNLDGVNWKARTYDDSAWLGPGAGLLHVENNPSVIPKNTELPPGYISQTSPIPRTYYFRTHFQFTGNSSGLSLTFSNYVDDGAVFYLNGAEIRRLRIPAAPAIITNLTPASGTPPCGTGGDATCPDVFTISGTLLTNLVQGDNVLAVEVHNAGAISVADIVFGCALVLSRETTVLPKLNIFSEDNLATLYWNGQGFSLQQLGDLSSSNTWTNVTGSSGRRSLKRRRRPCMCAARMPSSVCPSTGYSPVTR
jgi:hypothetical protein